MREKRVFIVDDDAGVRGGLTRILRALGYGVEVFADGPTFLRGVDDEAPTCALVDVCLPGMTGLDIVADLRNRRLDIPVVFTTGHPEIATCVRAMKEGAIDFLLKPLRKADLISAIMSAHLQSIRRHHARNESRRAEQLLAKLTAREREVLALVLEGRRNKEIAALLESQEATVKVHRSRLMRKLGVSSVPDLVRIGDHGNLAALMRHDDRDPADRDVLPGLRSAPVQGRGQASYRRDPLDPAINPWFDASGTWSGFTWRAQ